MKNNDDVTKGSKNVFADIRVKDPNDALVKAELARRISQIIRARRLKQVPAANILGIDQPKVSALLNGRLADFSATRLMYFLTLLGSDVEIVVKERSRRSHKGAVRVVLG